MDLIDPANTGLGHRQVQRWGLPDGWVISARPAHPALVSEEDFIAVQGIRAAREDADRAAVPAGRAAALRDLRAAAESCWSNGRPAYRCRHGHSSASAPDPARPKNLYIREDRILPHLPALHIRLPGRGACCRAQKAPHPPGNRRQRRPATQKAISYLRSRQITLTYHPATGTLQADTTET